MSPIPIVTIGRHPVIASTVKQRVLPDYDVIHIILTESQGIAELPLLLSDPLQVPLDSSTNLGSQNYSGAKILAVGAGGGFSEEQFNMIKDACQGVGEGVVWVRPDMSKLGDMPPISDAEAFGTEIAKRVKKKLDELRVGKEGGEKDGVHLWG